MPNNLSKALLLAHGTVGLAALLAPGRALSLGGLNPGRQSHFMTRLFGSRDLLLAYALAITSGSEQRLVLAAANAINAIDVVSGVVEYLNKNLSDRGFIIGSGGASLLLAFGWGALHNIFG